MTIIIYEDNLMWSVRLRNAVAALEHSPIVHASFVSPQGADCVIVSLSFRGVEEVVSECHDAAIPIIAHCGHKEKELLELGSRLQCSLVVSNGSLVPHLKSHLSQVILRENGVAKGQA